MMTNEERISILARLNKDELIYMIIEGWYIPDDVILKHKKWEINIPFETFWEKYAYKKWDKLWTKKKWDKLSDSERTNAMNALDIYLKERDPRYIAMPQTWINQKRWIAILEAEADKQKNIQTKQKQQQKQKSFDPLSYELKGGLYN